jgi:hypothetical protein
MIEKFALLLVTMNMVAWWSEAVSKLHKKPSMKRAILTTLVGPLALPIMQRLDPPDSEGEGPNTVDISEASRDRLIHELRKQGQENMEENMKRMFSEENMKRIVQFTQGVRAAR